MHAPVSAHLPLGHAALRPVDAQHTVLRPHPLALCKLQHALGISRAGKGDKAVALRRGRWEGLKGLGPAGRTSRPQATGSPGAQGPVGTACSAAPGPQSTPPTPPPACEPITRASTALPNSREKKSSSSGVPQYCGRSPTNRVAPSAALQGAGSRGGGLGRGWCVCVCVAAGGARVLHGEADPAQGQEWG